MTTATAVAMPEATVGIVVMTNEEARACVSRIKAAAEDICALLCELHEREGWRALGYKTWQECVKHEFQMSRQHAHRLINSHIVQRVLTPMLAERVSPIGDTPTVPESHARQLAPLIDKPDDLREAYADAIETTNGKPTDEAVHAAVDRKLGRPSKPLREKRSVSSGAERGDFQDVPDDPAALGFGDTAADEAAIVNNEPAVQSRPERFCSHCGDRYRGDGCPCQVTLPDDYPCVSDLPCSTCGGEIVLDSEEEDRRLAAALPRARCKACQSKPVAADTSTTGTDATTRNSVNPGRNAPAYSRPVQSGPPPLTIQGNAGDAMRAVADRFALDKVAEGIGEAYSDAERGSLTAQLLDSLTDAEKVRIAHRANVAVKSQPPVAPTLVQVAEMGETLSVGEQLGITSRWVKTWPVTDLERLATFLPHLIERKRREAANTPLAAAV